MTVETTHPEYQKMADEWAIVRACTAGQREVKALKRKALPAPDEREGNYDKERYEAYQSRAIYTNVTGRTKDGLSGAVFRKDPVIEFSPVMEYMMDNADGAGQSVIQVAKDIVGSMLETGRQGLLADYPEVEEGLTAEQVRLLNLTATIKLYDAGHITNWKTQSIGGKQVLTLVVLKEAYNASEDEFDHDTQDQYRVLRLRQEGYSQQLYRKGEPVTEEQFPKKSDGSNWEIIPFFLVGAQNNDPSIDRVPLADIAYVNLGHYRNSADLEENSFIHSQLTLGVTTDLDMEQWKTANPNGVVVGARTGHYLGQSGGFHSVQADANQLADKLMERKEAQMLSLGAKLIEKRNPNETAAAAKIDATGENSVLSDIVTNVEEGIQRCIEWCQQFMGDESEFTFEMNREFFPGGVDPQMVMAAIQLHDRAVIGKTDLRNMARKVEIIEDDRTDEDIDQEIGDISPLE